MASDAAPAESAWAHATREMVSEPLLSEPAVFEPPKEPEPAPDMATTRDRVAGAFAGLASGVTKLTIGHPFDTIKVRCQVEGGHGRFQGPVQCLVNTVRYEGFRALYRGASMPLVGWALMDAVQLGSLTNYRLYLQGHDKNRVLTPVEQGIAGIGAGWTVALVASPVEIIKVRLQMQYVSGAARQYKGPIDCARQLTQRYGPLGVYRGLHATLAQRSFFFFLWGGYDVYSHWLRSLRTTAQFPFLTTTTPARPNTPAYIEARKQGQMTERAVNFLAGGMAANTFWTLAFPVDVAKNRYMSQPDTNPLSFRKMFGHIYRTEGMPGFFRGFWPSFLRSAPTNATALLVWESVSSLIKHGHLF